MAISVLLAGHAGGVPVLAAESLRLQLCIVTLAAGLDEVQHTEDANDHRSCP